MERADHHVMLFPSKDALTSSRALCLALVLFVFCARALLILIWGSPLPFWDQWDAEAVSLYLRWLDGSFEWTEIIKAHNEHRIALTRLLDLAVFIVTGQWNIWVQLILNAAIHALTAGVLALIFLPALGARARTLLVAVLAILFAGTAGWQNALWGFQSQFYFSSLLSICAVSGLIISRPFSRNWWLGWIAGLLVLFSNAGGVLAVIAAMIVAVAIRSGESTRPRRAGALLLLGALIAFGLLLRVEAPHHLPLRAKSISQFVELFSQCLAWPHIQRGWLCILIQVPIGILLYFRWRSRTALDSFERYAVALGLLSVLHAAAIAYSRGAGLATIGPLSRYQDAFLPGMIAQLFALFRLGAVSRHGRSAMIVWLGITAVGLLSLTTVNLSTHLPLKRALDRQGIAFAREYLATSNPGVLLNQRAAQSIHPSNPAVVQRVLDESRLRAILPKDLLEPVGTPLTYPWMIAQSPWLAAISATSLLALLILQFRRTGTGSTTPRSGESLVSEGGAIFSTHHAPQDD